MDNIDTVLGRMKIASEVLKTQYETRNSDYRICNLVQEIAEEAANIQQIRTLKAKKELERAKNELV